LQIDVRKPLIVGATSFFQNVAISSVEMCAITDVLLSLSKLDATYRTHTPLFVEQGIFLSNYELKANMPKSLDTNLTYSKYIKKAVYQSSKNPDYSEDLGICSPVFSNHTVEYLIYLGILALSS
jgi:hypothetical protein